MGELGQQVGIVVSVLAACFVGPGIAFGFLTLRKRRARARRRSPIGINLLRGPGHSLLERLDEAQGDVLDYVIVLMLIPLMLLCIFLAHGHVYGLQRVQHLVPAYVILVVAGVAFALFKLLKAGELLDNLKAGFDAELAVGQELDQLMRQGAAVFHDVPADGFNIDHVVISCEGVFAVETKGFTKPRQGNGKANATVVFDGKSLRFPNWTTKEPLLQAERQAKWVSKWLASAIGLDVRVLPVLALPGWFVELTGRGDVQVFSGKQLSGLLRSRGTQRLSEQDVRSIAHQIEQSCRTVVPKYKEVKKAS